VKLFWNAIVKNEASRIERCMKSLVDHVDGAIVLDTGSTDNTIELIRNFFAAAGKPCEIGEGKFETWDQARNDALTLARNSDLPWDYLLLVDADMELVIIDPAWKDEIHGVGSMEMVQQGGTVVYTNSRILSRAATGVYRGVTHEYLDVPSEGRINGARFVDHADGNNRPGKARRDADLLRGGLEKEPQNGRYWYYLGQSLRDCEDWQEAIPAFTNAIRHSTWDEERWNARVNLANCYLSLGDRGAYYREMLDAFDERPSRAEALYDLAHHFREAGKNHASLIFSEFGLSKPLPKDILFVNEYPYKTGFKEEYAICGYYDPQRRPIAKRFNDELSLSREAGGQARFVARNNMFWYIETLKDLCPSAQTSIIDFTPPKGYVGMNPSLSQDGDLSVRCVNYTITPWGSYDIRKMDSGSNEVEGAPVTPDNPIHTRNFVRMAGNWCEIVPPAYEKKYNMVVGAEDMRLFRWNKELWSISNFRDRNEMGSCQQHVAKLVHEKPGVVAMEDLRHIEPLDFPVSYAEKNWMPWPRKDALWFVHRLGTILDHTGKTVKQIPKDTMVVDVDRLSGGGCVCDIGGGLWLVITHEAQFLPNEKHLRYYYHRFGLLSDDGTPLALSRPFVFQGKQIEFAAGLAILDDTVWVTYGVRDIEPWLCQIPLLEVKGLFK